MLSRRLDEKFVTRLVSYWEECKWVDVVRSVDPLPNRRKWVGFVSVGGKHEVTTTIPDLAGNCQLDGNAEIAQSLRLCAVAETNCDAVEEEGRLAVKRKTDWRTGLLIANRKMISEELVEVRVEKIHSDYVDGLEIGVRQLVDTNTRNFF